MNCWLNPINPWTGSAGKSLRKISDMVALPPERTYVVLDESPLSINDGWFVADVPKNGAGSVWTPNWISLPGSYHNKVGCLSFGDGHVEMRRWTDSNMVNAEVGNAPIPANGPDLAWLYSRATAF
jgi:hypothetical protein